MRERHSFVLCDIAVVDGTGGPVREHAFLEVLGSRIARIGDMADYSPHDGVEEIRLPGHYVMPGLIDAHVHLSGGSRRSRRSRDRRRGRGDGPESHALGLRGAAAAQARLHDGARHIVERFLSAAALLRAADSWPEGRRLRPGPHPHRRPLRRLIGST